jgi:hypothetical protein
VNPGVQLRARRENRQSQNQRGRKAGGQLLAP